MASDYATTAPLTSEQQMNVFRLRDKMSLLNAEFLKVLNGFYTEKSHYDFTVTMQSYMDHVKNLKVMYKVDDDVVVAMTAKPVPVKSAAKHAEAKSQNSGENPFQRKIAKAVRRNGSNMDSPKIVNSTVFAASSPAAAISAPKFGDISVIAKETPAPSTKSKEMLDSPAPTTARKRAIRGGGPLGGSESVIFKSGNEPQASTSTVNIPATTIKFPEPSKDFWTKKDTSNSEGNTSTNNGGSLFAFLAKDGEKSKEPAKFSGFSFGKKDDNSITESESKKNEGISASKSLFGSIEESAPKSSTGPSFGGITKASPASTNPTKPLVFGEQKKDINDSGSSSAPKPFAALSFGASLFGSSSTTSKPLSFGSSGTSSGGSMFSGFAGLAQKAVDNQSKPDGGDDDEAEYVPPKAETVEAEEPDAVLSSKVSVFKFSGKEYTKLGVGMLHIKDNEGKFSVLIRAATATGTVWLNALCNKAMKATKVDDKGERIRLTCPTSQTEMTTMMIRFGSADGAKKFTDKIEEVAK
ncbi:hypothetical protein GCK72_010195 [Caenorhabditis remanei]|uniref:Uncharacterized protein n=1 Tax=Caenorhabditis remanei TaxID=31234 RepID=A0A2P4VA68_CAERE|nr:hypothetical protein GCK72_010195 [Caenorhabditis remanei]KAF1761936.1 hypothetical protein GCK72_010195 [Caenorhabditis remanei]